MVGKSHPHGCICAVWQAQRAVYIPRPRRGAAHITMRQWSGSSVLLTPEPGPPGGALASVTSIPLEGPSPLPNPTIVVARWLQAIASTDVCMDLLTPEVAARYAGKELHEYVNEGVDELGRTLLHLAVAAGSLPAVESLLAVEGVDVNAVDAACRTPLSTLDKGSASAADIEAKLTAAGGEVISPLHASFYPIHNLVLLGDVQALVDKLDAGHTVKQYDYAGRTPLHAACGTGNIELVKLLLSKDADVCIKSRQGATPLDVACILKNTELEAVLCEAGAGEGEPISTKPPVDPSSVAALKGACGMTPLDVAAMQSAWALLSSQSKPGEAAATVRTLAIAFFELLFERHPELLELFYFKGPNNKPVLEQMEKHAIKVLSTLGAVLGLLDDFPTLAATATALLKRHVGYGVLLEHYDHVLGTLAAFLSSGLGELGLWDDLQASAWTKLITLVKAVATGIYAEDVTPAAETSAA